MSDMHGIEKRRRVRKDGTVRVTYRVRWVDAGGERRAKTFTDLARATEMRDRLDTLAVSIAAGPPARATMTVTDLRDRWWNEHVQVALAPRTITNYDLGWRRTEPHIGRQLAASVTRRTIKELRETLRHEGLGRGSVNYALSVLHAIFAHGLEDDVVDFNPVAGVRRLPTRPRRPQARNIPSLAAVERARAHATHQLGAPMTATIIALGVLTGLRPSEWRALHWYDIDLDARYLCVDKVAEPDGSLRPGGKTAGAERTVRILPELCEDLAAWRAMTPYPGALDPVFPRADGTTMRDEDYRRWATRKFRPAFAAAGASASPYTLRHIAISLLIQEGRASLIDIAVRHGTSIEMISRHYAHVFAAYDSTRIDLCEELAQARALAAAMEPANTPSQGRCGHGEPVE